MHKLRPEAEKQKHCSKNVKGKKTKNGERIRGRKDRTKCILLPPHQFSDSKDSEVEGQMRGGGGGGVKP